MVNLNSTLAHQTLMPPLSASRHGMPLELIQPLIRQWHAHSQPLLMLKHMTQRQHSSLEMKLSPALIQDLPNQRPLLAAMMTPSMISIVDTTIKSHGLLALLALMMPHSWPLQATPSSMPSQPSPLLPSLDSSCEQSELLKLYTSSLRLFNSLNRNLKP